MHNFEVKRKRNESIESLISRSGKKFIKSGLMKELKERRFFETKSQKRRRKQEWRA